MRATINIPPTRIRIRAVAMQLVADLDGHYVEMQTIAIACEVDSISAVQRHIERMSREL
jgi:hypothetical protein